MTSSGVNLLSGDVFNVHMTYDGTTLKMTITDANTPSQTFTTSWAINIPTTVGGNSAYLGLTGGTGGLTAIQEILTWTYVSTQAQTATATPTFSPLPGSYNTSQSVTLADTTPAASIYYTTDGTNPIPGTSKLYSAPVAVSTTSTIKAIATTSGYSNSNIASGLYTITTHGTSPAIYTPPCTTTTLALMTSANTTRARMRVTTTG